MTHHNSSILFGLRIAVDWKAFIAIRSGSITVESVVSRYSGHAGHAVEPAIYYIMYKLQKMESTGNIYTLFAISDLKVINLIFEEFNKCTGLLFR